MEMISSLYFSVFILSILVLVDLMLKFKRPLILKFYFSLLIIAIGGAALVHYLYVDSKNVILFLALTKAITASAFLNIFSILYFPKFKIAVNIFSIGLISLAVTLFTYIIGGKGNFLQYRQQPPMIVVFNEGFDIPWQLKLLRVMFILSFYIIILYFIYGIVKKYQYNNIYFDKIKKWTMFILVLCFGLLFLYLPIPLLRDSPIFSNGVAIIFYFYIILIVFYRPVFLNRSSMKISFGDSFTKESEYSISELEFINEFYTKSYYTKNDASLENLAKLMNISSNDLYKFIYYKYTMTFNDLVNKNRVEYFIDIIHNSKYLNYTIDALAKEAGFSSRQHLYKPFKKFHGGNPSDIVDAVTT